MNTSTGYEFDEKNREDFEKNTALIIEALNAIENDKKLSATFKEVARLTGLHRNTLSNRSIVVGDLKVETTVSAELKRISDDKKKQKAKDKVTKKNEVENLEGQLDNAKNELVYWFKKYQDLSLESAQLDIQLGRKADLIDWYKKELEAERQKTNLLQERINILEELNK
ncbi:hypothetical protein NB548_15455 [Vibrio parahaemolyticus]|uniref:hypothetical protein n=1 Tax=Vibrio parahaemolyticus TaxID=670 RepID=UPI00215B7897|nr:hypothetical protein [Vibrio parahaemolyticus]MCR9712330.1 hypothetical protein [Vibrio parahaemolyticus]